MDNDSTCISTVEISYSEVYRLLKSLDLSKAGGPDQLSPFFIVSCAKSITIPICILFERSLTEGVVPNIWKSAFVTPIFKKGDKTDIVNYRPISKICLFAKVLERIVHNSVYTALKCKFGEEQHGFIRNRSTTSNLILSHEYITKGMEHQGQVDVIYTDYSKCFDSIDHRVLLDKLMRAGIHGSLYRWFSSYIENRTQAVVLRGYSSDWVAIPSGVPQGSILGPLLFTIFIADVKLCFRHSYVLLYADDMKIHKVVRDVEDIKCLQLDLERFEEYCKRNRLKLNVSKCFHITFSRRKAIINAGFKLCHQNINKVSSIRDLGIILDSKLLFDQHIDGIVKKAAKALGFIIRNTADFRTLKPVKILYCSFVRSHLEYASQVWNPQYEMYTSRIEGIQKKFLRYLDYKAKLWSEDYIHRCKRYHFLPLETRRHINDICMLLNIADGTVDSPELVANLSLKTNPVGLRQRPLLQAPFATTNYRRNAFLLRVARSFNAIPSDLNIDLFCTSASTARRLLAKSFFDA